MLSLSSIISILGGKLSLPGAIAAVPDIRLAVNSTMPSCAHSNGCPLPEDRSQLPPHQRQFQGEGGPPTRSVALDGQRAAQVLGRQDAAVQAEAMSAFARREPLRENARQVFCRNPNPIVNHLGLHAFPAVEPEPHCEPAAGAAARLARVAGVLEQVE